MKPLDYVEKEYCEGTDKYAPSAKRSTTQQVQDNTICQPIIFKFFLFKSLGKLDHVSHFDFHMNPTPFPCKVMKPENAGHLDAGTSCIMVHLNHYSQACTGH